MNLILWRHAEAEVGSDDMARGLTHKGHVQAMAMGAWLKRHLPRDTELLASPAKRAQQTAEALSLQFETCASIAPDCSADDLLLASGWPQGGNVLLVGHQPALGRLAARLLSGSEADWSIRKGAIWWLVRREREGREQVLLHAALTAALAGKS